MQYAIAYPVCGKQYLIYSMTHIEYNIYTYNAIRNAVCNLQHTPYIMQHEA